MLRQGIGGAGSLLAGACCVGFAPVLTGVSALGAGALINDAILFPLLAVFLGTMLWGLVKARGRHGQPQPLYFGIAGALLAFIGPWLFIPLAYAGFLAIIAAVAWDWTALLKAGRTDKAF